LLESNERMQQEVFSHLEIGAINKYNQRVMDANLHLLSNYLAPRLHPYQVYIQHKTTSGAQP
jgi:hypothetical protein